jgi:hypothetical protein
MRKAVWVDARGWTGRLNGEPTSSASRIAIAGLESLIRPGQLLGVLACGSLRQMPIRWT